MSLKQHIFKPKWQHKDPAIRRLAVSELHDPELLESLQEICISDEDSGVRTAAARRINDPEVLLQALGLEQDQEALKVLNHRIESLCASTEDARPPLAARQNVISASNDRQLLELVARQAPEPELRKAALCKINRQGFLGDRAISDPDPELRRSAAALVTQHSTLKRVIEAVRKSDKNLHLELQARLHAELLDANDPGAVYKEALAQCMALEAYALEHQESAVVVPAEISKAWSGIEAHVPVELTERYQNIAARLSQITKVEVHVHPQPVEDVVTVENPGATADEPHAMPEPEPELKPKHESGPESKLEPEQELKPASDEAALKHKEEKLKKDKLKKEKLKEEKHKEKNLVQAETLLAQLEQQLDDGALHKALETRHLLTEAGKTVKKERRWKSVSSQVSALHGRLQELRDWHHWSNDKIRNQLIIEMEVLPETDLHPDAILDRVKSLQSQWKSLETSEQIPGDSHYHAAQWMWRKFSAAGHKAFKSAKPFLEKRDEIRNKHLQIQKDLCEQVTVSASSERPDWAELSKLLQGLRKEMRSLDTLPHKARKNAASRLRKALDKGNAAMQGHYSEIEKQKLKLVRSAAQLVHIEDMDEAISKAKRLQADWKAAGRLWRSRENELWKAFREPLDPLFGKLKADRESNRAAVQEKLESQKVLCKDLKTLLSGTDDSLHEMQGKVQGLKSSWRDIEHPDRRLQKQFQELAENFKQRLEAHRDKQASAIRENWWVKSQLLHELESALIDSTLESTDLEKFQADWPPGSGEEIDRVLDKRFKDAIAGGNTTKIDKSITTQATELCIQLEFLAGLPSPGKEKDQRMKYQVDRLSKSLAGEAQRVSAEDEALMAEMEWLTLPLLPQKSFSRFEHRIKAALAEIKRNNNV